MSCIIEFLYVLPKGAPPLNFIFQKSGSFERKERRSFERGSLSSIGALSSKCGICTFSLYELALLYSQTTWITEVLSQKSFNVRPTLVIKVFWASMYYSHWHMKEVIGSFLPRALWRKIMETLKALTMIALNLASRALSFYYTVIFTGPCTL